MKKFRQRLVSFLRLPILRQISVAVLTLLLAPLIPGIRKSFTVMQVGGRGGADPYTKWLRSRGKIKTVGVEPESSGLEKIKQTKAYDFVLPVALGEKPGSAPLYITKARGWCSLLKPDEAAIKQVATEKCFATRPFDVVGTETIEVTTLDAVKSKLPTIDYLQIDVQGAELHVLKGGVEMLRTVSALELEVRYFPLYENEPLYPEVDAFLQQHGFALFQMTRQGETEFGDKFVEANACYVSEKMTDADLKESLMSYGKAKHTWYANPLLRLLTDIQSTNHLQSTIV